MVDAAETEAQNEKFYRDYQNGCLDIDAFLKLHLAPLARYSKEELAEFHREFMAEYIIPTSRLCSVCWCRATKWQATKPS